jgi:hypothetical protein
LTSLALRKPPTNADNDARQASWTRIFFATSCSSMQAMTLSDLDNIRAGSTAKTRFRRRRLRRGRAAVRMRCRVEMKNALSIIFVNSRWP